MNQTAGALEALLEDIARRAAGHAADDVLRRLGGQVAAPPPAMPVPSEPQTDRRVSVVEAARLCGVHRTTILRYEQQRTIPPRRKLPGGRTGWLLSEVQAFLATLETVRVARARTDA